MGGDSWPDNETAEQELERLRAALVVHPADLSLNRQVAALFEYLDDYTNAIRCWERISQQRPHDSEARLEISRLIVQRLLRTGNHAAHVRACDALAAANFDLNEVDTASQSLMVEFELCNEVRRNPFEVQNYITLADHYLEQSFLELAERIMKEAADITGDARARQHLETMREQRLRKEAG